MSLKVLQAIDRLNAGGAERVLVNLANLLKKKGVHVAVCSLLGAGPLDEAIDSEVEHRRLYRDFKYSLITLFRFHQYANQFDIVHVHMRHNLKYVWLAKFLYRGSYRIVFHDHYGEIHRDRHAGFFLKLAMKSSTYVGVSTVLCDWAQSHGLPSKRVNALFNTVEKKAYKQVINPVSPMKLILVSNFRPQKNLEFAVDLIDHMRMKNEVRLDLFGQFSDNAYFEKIKKMVQERGLNEHFRFIHDCTDIQSVLGHYHCAIHTATSETGPLVLLEYLAQGLPFLCFRVGEVPEQIISEFPEYVLDHFDVERWSTSIKALIQENSTTFRKQRIQFFTQKFSQQEYVNSCLDIYRRALA